MSKPSPTWLAYPPLIRRDENGFLHLRIIVDGRSIPTEQIPYVMVAALDGIAERIERLRATVQ
jgi:hypothetical protein